MDEHRMVARLIALEEALIGTPFDDRRLSILEQRMGQMSAIVDALIAREAKLEEIVAAVVDENAKLHAELNEALVNGDLSAVQGVVDRLGVVNDKLSSIVPAPAPTLVVEVPVTEAPVEAPAAEAPVDPAA